jgi:hypothetical protein
MSPFCQCFTLRAWLAGNVEEQLGLFAERMREGLLAASVAIGLEVMSELQEAEVPTTAPRPTRPAPARLRAPSLLYVILPLVVLRSSRLV